MMRGSCSPRERGNTNKKTNRLIDTNVQTHTITQDTTHSHTQMMLQKHFLTEQVNYSVINSLYSYVACDYLCFVEITIFLYKCAFLHTVLLYCLVSNRDFQPHNHHNFAPLSFLMLINLHHNTVCSSRLLFSLSLPFLTLSICLHISPCLFVASFLCSFLPLVLPPSFYLSFPALSLVQVSSWGGGEKT